MKKPEIPSNEQARLTRLRALDLLDGPAEEAIDAFTELATRVLNKPIGLVSLVDSDRQFFKSAVGCIPQGGSGERESSFCGHAILNDEVFEIEDARTDDRFADNPFVTGDPFVVHYAGAPLVLPGGEAIGTLCLIDHKPGRLNDTERYMLKKLASMLSGFLVLRERALRELKKAEEASRAKSEFLATMSHEIRTPINGVIGLAQILGRRQLPAQEAQYVGMIEGCANTLLSLVDDILDFSKIEAGRVSIEAQDTDLHALVRELCDLQRVRAKEKGLVFRGDISFDVPRRVSIDSHRLRQILLNLLANAWKFTQEGSYSLRVGVDAADRGPVLVFEVQDSGIGIDADAQKKLFTRFTQADGSTTRGFGGTGLGLAIVKQLAQLMGGDVALSSEIGKGSCFTVQLPLVAAQSEADPMPSKPAAQGAPAFSDARVLVVDDNEVNRIVAEGLLRGLGYRNVSLAEDGEQALRACEQGQFDLVLMDCQMPVLDGYAATREMRSRGIATPVIALTASATSDDRALCLAAGMTGYLTKPISRGALGEAIQAVLAVQNDFGRPSLLVVDDNDVNRTVAQLMLEQLGYTHVDFACDGKEAIEMASRGNYGAVLMDCLMPVMDGYEATRQLREQGYGRPIIALTAGSGDEWQQRCLDAGMDAMVSKPLFVGELQRALNKVLAASRASAAVPA